MRDIEFRGKTEGKWIYGYLIEIKNTQNETKDVCIIEKTSFFDFLSGKLLQDYYKVTPQTVGQYIGLNDNYGQKVFEGDIMQDPLDLDKIYVVDFMDGEFVLINDVDVIIDIEQVHFLSVIGNIHDNKKVLKARITKMFNKETPERNVNRKCSEIDCLTRLLAQIDRTKINNEIQIKVVAAGLSFDITCNGNKQNKQPLDIPPVMRKNNTPEGGGKLW